MSLEFRAPDDLKLRMARLAQMLPVIESRDLDFGEWRGGDRREDESITMPWFEFSAQAREVIEALPVVVFDWGKWMETDEARAFLADYGLIATATPEQLTKLSTALVRGDRFSEGTLAWAYESGLLAAIVRRAAALSE